jgi:hypothetical protein
MSGQNPVLMKAGYIEDVIINFGKKYRINFV